MLANLFSKLKSLFQPSPPSPPDFFQDPRWQKLSVKRKLRICAVREAILEGWEYKDIAELTNTEIGVIRQDAYLLRSLSLLNANDYVNAYSRRRRLPQHTQSHTGYADAQTNQSLV